MLTEKEIREASKRLALEELRHLTDKAEEMENVELLIEAQRGYANFMEKYHRRIQRCS